MNTPNLLDGLDCEAVLNAPIDLDAALANEQSGLWHEDEPGEPTVAELEKPANPTPEWCKPRAWTKPKSRRKAWHEAAPNHCKCKGFATTGHGGVAKRPETAADLCSCQVKMLFLTTHGPSENPPRIDAGMLRMFLFGKLRPEYATRGNWPRTDEPYPFEDPTPDDLDHIAWMIEMNRAEWTAEAELNKPQTVEQHKALCRSVGMSDAEFDGWHGEGKRKRELAKHHTH